MESLEAAPGPPVAAGRARVSASMATMRAAFRALDRAAVPYTLRKSSWPAESLSAGAEVDIALPSAWLASTDAVLRVAGFHRFASAASPGHRFYVAFGGSLWLKIDAKITGRRVQPLSRWWASILRNRLVRALALRRPLALRRLGPVIAVLGPDGAGKGTIIGELQHQISIGLATVYLGWRPRARRARSEPSPRRPDALREALYVIYWALRYWRALLPGYVAAWSGHIVLCDRHPIENLAIRPRTTRLGARLDQLLFGRLMPWPDAVLLLDASGATLAARKHEDSPAALERRRRAYSDLLLPRGATLISTEQSVDHSSAQAAAAVWKALCGRRGW